MGAPEWSKVDGLWTTMRNSELSRMLGVRYGLVAIARHARIVRAKREGKSAEPYIYQR